MSPWHGHDSIGGRQTEVEQGTNVVWGEVGSAGQSAVLWQALFFTIFTASWVGAHVKSGVIS